ncbi:MAG TPA: gamma-glutamyltransferase [Rhizomicrobium sp.]|nr:gamma-glutamyltransferase [Rhizomicrobium sp.]
MVRVRTIIGIAGLSLLGCCAQLGLSEKQAPVGAMVVGDEPNAARAASSILSFGGNAADAAAAMYFALSVTYPVAAGLGGGGICLVHDGRNGREVEFDFLARDASGGGAYATPGNVRGFVALQTQFGALPWPRVVAPAEEFAGAGFPISVALAKRLNAAQDVVRLDAGLAAEFMDESGRIKPAGSIVSNRELAATLAAIRTQGADALYKGPIAARIAAYSTSEGGTIGLGDLASYPVTVDAPRALAFGNQFVIAPRQSTGAGAFAGALLDGVLAARGLERGHSAEAAVVEATKRALAGFGVADLPKDLGSTGFAVTDTNGEAVACAVTMNGPFGSGHTVAGAGFTLAGAPSASKAGLASAFLTPVISMSSDRSRLFLAGAGTGGPVGTASIIDALARLGKGDALARAAIPDGDITLYDTVNAIVCQNEYCSALTDAKSQGMAAAPVSPGQ